MNGATETQSHRAAFPAGQAPWSPCLCDSVTLFIGPGALSPLAKEP